MPFTGVAHKSREQVAPGFGLLWIDQVEPFQRSANGVPKSPVLDTLVDDPAAVQADAAVHETALSVIVQP